MIVLLPLADLPINTVSGLISLITKLLFSIFREFTHNQCILVTKIALTLKRTRKQAINCTNVRRHMWSNKQ